MDIDQAWQLEESAITPPGSPGSALNHLSASASASAAAASPKRSSRRSVQKRVVTVPISELDGSRPKSGTGEGAPPSDSWAWRKYGQKPIKGSPYPRGYYRCSSSKGCPARKQVERSRADPTTLVVTYACEHNHPWPVPKTQNHHHSKAPLQAQSPSPSPSPSPEEDVSVSVSVSVSESVSFSVVSVAASSHFGDGVTDRYSDLIDVGDYYWLSDAAAASPSGSTDDLLLGPIPEDSAGMSMAFCCDELRGGGAEEEEDSLFAGLGELPECSVVFRRGYLESRQLGVAASR